MNIIICGAGRVGFSISNLLSAQGHSITVIDQSSPFKVNFYDKYDLNIKVIRQEEPRLWSARNKAIIESDETIIALLDDDSRLDQNWITKHLQCLDYYDADISAGVSISMKGGKVPENYSKVPGLVLNIFEINKICSEILKKSSEFKKILNGVN